MRNLVLVVEYDGMAYHGFQIQPSGATIQGEIEAALLEVTGVSSRITGAGRTDAGVHASGQVVSFRTESSLPPIRLMMALNGVLPEDIVVKDAFDARPGFDARFSAQARLYRYAIWNALVPSALHRLYSYHWRGALDVVAMQSACQVLIGTHDFASFANMGAGSRQMSGTTRTLFHADCRRNGEMVEIHVAANAFLPRMVRGIVGTLLWVGIGKIDVYRFAKILASRNRSMAGPNVPPRGLCLIRAYYADEDWPQTVPVSYP